MIEEKEIINERPLQTRDTSIIIKESTELHILHQQIKSNISEIRLNFKTYENLNSNGINAENILRSQIVFLLSALDFYIHEIARINIVAIFQGKKEETKSYKNFLVSISVVNEALTKNNTVEILTNEIIYRNSFKTFLASEEIKKILSLISPKKLYQEMCDQIKVTPETMNTKLDDIYKRRNQIAHQLDINNVSKIKNNITQEYVEESINFIELFIETLHKLIIAEF